MPEIITAVYENGVLRPLVPLLLREHQTIQIQILPARQADATEEAIQALINAGLLIQRHPLRAYDSIQLAAALRLQPTFAQLQFASLTFVSADNRLLAVAQAEGITTDNPTLHP